MGGVVPMLLQNKLSVFFPGQYEGGGQDSMASCPLDAAQQRGLLFQGYGVEKATPGLLSPETDVHVQTVAFRHARHPRQVLFRWAMQLGAAIVADSAVPNAVADAEAVLSFELPTGDV